MVKSHFPGAGVLPTRMGSSTTPSDFLGRDTRTGTWEELAQGTFRQARDAVRAGNLSGAMELVEVSLLEAQELREVYEEWPEKLLAWMRQRGASEEQIETELSRLTALIGNRAMNGIEAAWPQYVTASQEALTAIAQGSPDTEDLIEATRQTWQHIHDEAVDRVSGLISAAVSLCGEHQLGSLWDHLLADWYEVHERRYALDHQPWETSAHQLMVSIVDGFHAHLAGTQRAGDIEIVRETDRIGFRFAPCGSGGRSVAPDITDGKPRAGAPFNFAVTTEQHDWAWNTIGICSYCVHCCQLNELMPIDRLGYPTRVIDPPVWTGETSPTQCTWWVYRHPSLVPDAVYHRVGRSPDRRPLALNDAEEAINDNPDSSIPTERRRD